MLWYQLILDMKCSLQRNWFPLVYNHLKIHLLLYVPHWLFIVLLSCRFHAIRLHLAMHCFSANVALEKMTVESMRASYWQTFDSSRFLRSDRFISFELEVVFSSCMPTECDPYCDCCCVENDASNNLLVRVRLYQVYLLWVQAPAWFNDDEYFWTSSISSPGSVRLMKLGSLW